LSALKDEEHLQRKILSGDPMFGDIIYLTSPKSRLKNVSEAHQGTES
jgi:hypothetical protein